MRYEEMGFIVTEVAVSRFRMDTSGKTPARVNVTALHRGDDALVYEAPIQSAPKVGDEIKETVEWGEGE